MPNGFLLRPAVVGLTKPLGLLKEVPADPEGDRSIWTPKCAEDARCEEDGEKENAGVAIRGKLTLEVSQFMMGLAVTRSCNNRMHEVRVLNVAVRSPACT